MVVIRIGFALASEGGVSIEDRIVIHPSGLVVSSDDIGVKKLAFENNLIASACLKICDLDKCSDHLTILLQINGGYGQMAIFRADSNILLAVVAGDSDGPNRNGCAWPACCSGEVGR